MTLAYSAPLPSARYGMLDLCLLILRDYCPPDRCMYLCTMVEDDIENCCEECWINYLHYIGSLGRCDPYRIDRQRVQ